MHYNDANMTDIPEQDKKKIARTHLQGAIKKGLWIVTYFFAVIGVFLVAGYVAIRLGWTNVPGAIDLNDRYFTNLHRSGATPTASSTGSGTELSLWCKLFALQKSSPADAERILSAYHDTESPTLALHMVNALTERIATGTSLKNDFDACDIKWLNERTMTNENASETISIYPWINTPEWITLRDAVRKDAPVVNRASAETGIEPRLIVAQLIGEQLRLYNSERELYKAAFAPLKILGSETQFSLGVAGIKPDTAITVEQNLQDQGSDYYPGAAYSHLLDFTTSDHDTERYARITDEHDHYYAYLYTALFIKEVEAQWEKAGFAISHRPEIIGTLYNIGFSGSHPNADPHVGGSTIMINGVNYTFGSLGYEFYYSGELADVFPYWK